MTSAAQSELSSMLVFRIAAQGELSSALSAECSEYSLLGLLEPTPYIGFLSHTAVCIFGARHTQCLRFTGMDPQR